MRRMIIALLIPFFALVTVQICLKNPQTREMFTDIEASENISYDGLKNTREYVVVFYKEGVGKLDLYFNGEKIADFNSDTLSTTVSCDGVFEIKNDSNPDVKITAFCKEAGVVKNTPNDEFNRGFRRVCEINVD